MLTSDTAISIFPRVKELPPAHKRSIKRKHALVGAVHCRPNVKVIRKLERAVTRWLIIGIDHADWEDYLEYRELVNDVAAAESELDRGEYLTQAEAKRDALAERERIKRELGL